MKNFDDFIGIDWSGAKAPEHTKSISVAHCEAGKKEPAKINPEGTKLWSRAQVGAYLKSLSHSEKRILVGIDANFGYAREVGQAQFGADYIVQDLWQAVEQANDDQANYFAGNYWPQWPEYFWTQGKKPEHIKLPRRIVENACGQAGLGWPESPFKLIGPKQVGKGGLAAMRLAYDLKKSCDDKICIWPFEDDMLDKANLVISEIYPRQFLKRAGHGNAKIKTVDDLNKALVYFESKPIQNLKSVTDHDTDALVSAAGLRWLCGSDGHVPHDVVTPAHMDEKAKLCEGWIFGV